jgi:hypothetical protein
VLVEPAELGNLRDFLRACRATSSQPQTVSVEVLLELSLQVAMGMTFLSSKGVIHGQLAAHNGRFAICCHDYLWVDSSGAVVLGSKQTAKISNFGLDTPHTRVRGHRPCSDNAYIGLG